jgi:Tfp pilus assembly protein PilP
MLSPVLVFVLALAGLAGGAAPGPVATRETASVRRVSEQEAVYRRERFVYPSDGRRSPFAPLVGEGVESGPVFDDLDLVGIIFGGPAGSVATVIDRATEKRYRVRRGDIVGDARVVEIQPDAVVFQVTEFGVTRSETLALRRNEARATAVEPGDG